MRIVDEEIARRISFAEIANRQDVSESVKQSFLVDSQVWRGRELRELQRMYDRERRLCAALRDIARTVKAIKEHAAIHHEPIGHAICVDILAKFRQNGLNPDDFCGFTVDELAKPDEIVKGE